MNIFLNNFFSNLPVAQAQHTQSRYCLSFLGCKNTGDSFEKSSRSKSVETVPDTPESRKAKAEESTKSQSEGKVLRELDNITCPYSGIKMISSKRIASIEKRLEKCENYHEMLDVVGEYEINMQPHEKKIYHMFREYERTHPKGSLRACLRERKPHCLKSLRLEENDVLNRIDQKSKKLGVSTAFEVGKATTDARNMIFNDEDDRVFSRGELISEVYDIIKNHKNIGAVNEILEIVNDLPKSTTSLDAFVVKYSTKYSEEHIARRLLYPSISSVEHIKPHHPYYDTDEMGESELTNFMAASHDWNSARMNLPLPKFIEKHPKIPVYSQRYINDIINAIHNHELKGCNWYPYFIKERLFNESKGYIDLDLSRYKICKETAFYNVSSELKEKYDKLVEENKSIKPRCVSKKRNAKNKKSVNK